MHLDTLRISKTVQRIAHTFYLTMAKNAEVADNHDWACYRDTHMQMHPLRRSVSSFEK